MKQKQRIFIYDRKEMGVLLLLGVMVAVFAFTLGIHLGKRVGGKGASATVDAAPVTTLPDKTPESKDLADQTKNAAQAADETLNQSLHDEVGRTGMKLDTAKQVALPKGTKSANAGATTLKGPSDSPETPKAPSEKESEPAAETPTRVVKKPAGPLHYTLQVGSYPVLKEANTRADEIRNQGLNPMVQEAEIHGKGTWYRIYLGEFPTKFEAERAGQHYQAERLIDTFVVAKLSSSVPQ